MSHPACDFAKHVMQVALAGTGVWLSDGATNIMPVGPHRATPDGAVDRRPSATRTRRRPSRVAAPRRPRPPLARHRLLSGLGSAPGAAAVRATPRVYAFFLEGLDAASDRLRNFVEKAAQATLVGDVFDDAATGQGLLNYFLRAMNCGAISEERRSNGAA